MAMLERQKIVLSSQEVSIAIAECGLKQIPRETTSKRAEALERALADIRVCYFLSFGEEGTLRFAHKSYFEFFVVQFIFLTSGEKSSDLNKSAKRLLSREIIYFLGSFARDNKPFGDFLRVSSRRPRIEPATVNLVRRIVFASCVLQIVFSIAGGTIEGIDLRRASVENAFIQDVTLKSSFPRLAVYRVPSSAV
ncbi:MAG: hypothetical protein MZV49_07315 [Rhodopseudomonas palustris]|nr:hypothetical protein [Rhodopseudomonas palustris]